MPIRKLFLFLLSLALFGMFVLFSFLVAKEAFSQIDFDTTVKLQDRIPRRMDLPFSVFSILGLAEITTLAWLAILITLLLKKYFLASLAFFAFWVGLFLEVFGKVFVLHPAPAHFLYRGVLELNLPSYYVHTDYSYPSGHVYRTAFLVSFLLIWASFKLRSSLKIISLLLLGSYFLIMLISRVYLGEHWLSDVIGGSLLGASFGILAGIFIPKKKSNLTLSD